MLGHAHTLAQTHKFLMNVRFSAVPQFTKAATGRLIWSAQSPQHLLLSLLLGIHRHTKLPTGIKAYINSRGPDTVNPAHNSHTRGSSAVQQDHVNAVLIKDECEPNTDVFVLFLIVWLLMSLSRGHRASLRTYAAPLLLKTELFLTI